MRLYTVHLRRHGLDPHRDLVLVKEGFCWPAFLVSVFWALWHRLWLAALILLALQAGLGLIVVVLGPDPLSEAVLALGLALVVGFVAGDLRRWTLGRQGFVLASVVQGIDRETAERRYLDSEPSLAAEMAWECRL